MTIKLKNLTKKKKKKNFKIKKKFLVSPILEY